MKTPPTGWLLACASLCPAAAAAQDEHLDGMQTDALIDSALRHVDDEAPRAALYYLTAALTREDAPDRPALTLTVAELHRAVCEYDDAVARAREVSRDGAVADAAVATDARRFLADLEASSRVVELSFTAADDDADLDPTSEAPLWRPLDPATQPPMCDEEIDRRLRAHLTGVEPDAVPPPLSTRVPLGAFEVGPRPLSIEPGEAPVALALTVPVDRGPSPWVWVGVATGAAAVGGVVLLFAAPSDPPQSGAVRVPVAP